MSDNPEIPDPLEEEFQELERKVRQRGCGHEVEVDITTIGDGARQLLCIRCERKREVEFPAAQEPW